jgi:hypothetical protein
MGKVSGHPTHLAPIRRQSSIANDVWYVENNLLEQEKNNEWNRQTHFHHINFHFKIISIHCHKKGAIDDHGGTFTLAGKADVKMMIECCHPPCWATTLALPACSDLIELCQIGFS